ncbi:hypothetical protein DFJ58DRAFT_718844 [Suillus subalutaceus]|uniref:uncharacterized protein n=1 Tax=Suillus subalutaceus TaxID=48586 RepID=UPI001B86AE36|nr:uncharacterized protein DFJ58DRAFT_718844 [Suillus subalutaceus]KAG1837725.1 hypothetical protein DFJ58DRAFT_718844 [Suillus subalutaceus]
MTTQDVTSSVPSKHDLSALQMGPQKKVSSSDLLVSHGRHFCRMVFVLCNYPSLLTNGILRLELLEDTPLEKFSAEECREHYIFEQLLDSYPSLLERLKDGSEEEILHIGELIGKGAAGARGEAIQPPLHRNSKIDRSFNHELMGSLLCPTGLNWNNPHLWGSMTHFLYAHRTYDPEDLWCGLLRSHLLVFAYKYVFTFPRNVRLHGINSVTITSVAYITTQVQFALSSSSVFSWTDTTMDSEMFYHSLLNLLEDPEECQEVDELLTWWNHQVFPTSSAVKRPISANSTLSKIQQKCLALKQATNQVTVSP